MYICICIHIYIYVSPGTTGWTIRSQDVYGHKWSAALGYYKVMLIEYMIYMIPYVRHVLVTHGI